MLMAADVSSLVRILSRYKEEKAEMEALAEGKRDLITRDLLGGCGAAAAVVGSKELDLDLKVPQGWEKRLDLASGEVFFQRSTPTTTTAAASTPGLQDLNMPPLSSGYPVPPPPPNLELKLFPSSSIPSADFQSVCTLDKVKSALDRLATTAAAGKRTNKHVDRLSPSPTSSSTTTSSMRQKQQRRESGGSEEEGDSRSSVEEDGSGEGGAAAALMVAVGCPSCLSYVLVSKRSPRCPRCNSGVALPVTKRPRLDLNLNSGNLPPQGMGSGSLN